MRKLCHVLQGLSRHLCLLKEMRVWEVEVGELGGERHVRVKRQWVGRGVHEGMLRWWHACARLEHAVIHVEEGPPEVVAVTAAVVVILTIRHGRLIAGLLTQAAGDTNTCTQDTQKRRVEHSLRPGHMVPLGGFLALLQHPVSLIDTG